MILQSSAVRVAGEPATAVSRAAACACACQIRYIRVVFKLSQRTTKLKRQKTVRKRKKIYEERKKFWRVRGVAVVMRAECVRVCSWSRASDCVLKYVTKLKIELNVVKCRVYRAYKPRSYRSSTPNFGSHNGVLPDVPNSESTVFLQSIAKIGRPFCAPKNQCYIQLTKSTT